ncbi:MAG: DUF3526 domain-containing protein [Bacteroidota bacterium]
MPSPLLTVARTEARLLRADRTALWVTLLFAAATAYALVTGLDLRAERAEAARTILAADAEQWASGEADADSIEQVMRAENVPLDTYEWGPRSPYAVGMAYGRSVTAEPTPLSALAVGQVDLYPVAYEVTAGNRVAVGTSDALASPLRLAAGSFDLAFVLLYLLPLLALALGYDLTASERERGTLRLVLAQPLLRRTLVAGKLLARGGLLALLVIAATTAGFVASGGGLGPWALWTAATLLYGLFWLGLAAAVDARGRSAAANAVVLAVCWLGLGVVFPAAVTLLAGQVHPAPTRAAFVAATRTAEADITQRGTEPLAQFLSDHPEMAEAVGDETAAAESFAVMAVARNAAVAEALEPIVAQFAEQRARQTAFVRTVGALSPSILAHAAFLDLAGTGDAQQRRTLDAVETYQEQWRDHFEPLVFADTPFNAADYPNAPRFTPAPEAPGEAARQASGPLVGLALASLLVLGFGFLFHSRATAP